MPANETLPGSNVPPRSGPRTSRRLAELHDRTTPALEALGDIVAGHARRRARDPVPTGIEADAAALLAAAGRVLSREPGWRALLRPRARPAWSELEARLALALVGLRRFKQRYYAYDDALGAWHWQVGGRARHASPLARDDRNAHLVRRAMAALERQFDDLEYDR